MLNWWLTHVVTAKVFLRAPHILIPTRETRITHQGTFTFIWTEKIAETRVPTFCGIGARTLGME